MKLFSNLFNQKKSIDNIDESEALILSKTIDELENRLASDKTNAEVQKTLMIKYNQALKTFVKCPHYKDRVDSLFIKIDDLRNITRHSI